jgi:hypothetical protein
VSVGKRSDTYDKGKLVECVLRDLDLANRDWLRERLRKEFTTQELVIVRDAISLLAHKAECKKWRKKWEKL